MERFDQKIDDLNVYFRKLRGKLFWPWLFVFNKIGLTANSLSIFKVLFGLGYLLLIPVNLTAALWVVGIGMGLDLFDGALARMQHKDNDRGKFVDIVTDHLIFVIFWWGLMIAKIGQPIVMSYIILILPVLYLLVIINKNEHIKSDWLIRPIARLTYYKAYLIIVFLLHYNFLPDPAWFDASLVLIGVVLTVHVIYHGIWFFYKPQSI